MNIQILNTTRSVAQGPLRKYEIRATRHGFSLIEVLIAVGMFAVGMLFIAGVFPVSVYFATVATERTIAAAVADEAFAKIKLYGIPAGLSYINQTPYTSAAVPFDEYAYPSTPTADPNSKRYWWSAICERVPGSLDDIQVTVFVSRKIGMTAKYRMRDPLLPGVLGTIDRPVPVFISVIAIAGGRADELSINDTLVPFNFINDGYTIVDDATGNIYRVLERYRPPFDSVIRLDKDRQGAISRVWVIPAPVGGGRYPCIGVYQKVMRF